MSEIALPPLPVPDGSASVVVGHQQVAEMVGDVIVEADAWSEPLVRAYARQAVLAERERCIRIAEGDYEHLTVGIDPHASVGRMIAAAIRRGSV